MRMGERKTKRHHFFFSLLFSTTAILLLTGPGNSQAGEAEFSYTIPHTRSGPVIDGQIAKGEWDLAERVYLDIETNPSQNIPALVDTEVLMLEDGENFYLAFIAFDPEPEKIRAFYRDRDSMWADDFVGIVIDTFNDERRAFEFFANPLGVQGDAIFDDVVENEDTSWNAIWDSAGKITSAGYIVEMKIPLDQLRFPEGLDKQTWGIDLLRFHQRDKRHRLSNNRMDYDSACYLCQFKKAQGFADLEQNVNLQVVPTITASFSRDLISREEKEWEEKFDPEAGVDIRWGINQDFYLNATINPDFSQVEADVAQLNVNNAFLLFFPERREFFLDGADYFNTNADLVYTRNISSPEYGLKLTGKRDVHTYGLFYTNDETTHIIIPSNQDSKTASLENEKSMNTAFRYRLDISKNMNLGMIFTDRRADDYANTVSGIDSNIRIGNSDRIEMQFMKSYSEYPDHIQVDFSQKEKIDDHAWLIGYEHNDKRWHWEAGYQEFGDDFRADMGFINRVDFRQLNLGGGHIWRFGPGSKFSRVYVGGDFKKSYDESGNELEEAKQIFINADGPWQTYAFLGYLQRERLHNGIYFDEYNIDFFSRMRPMAGMEISLSLDYGDRIDFGNTRLGKALNISPQINTQIGKHFQIAVRHNFEKMEVGGKKVYTTHLSDVRFTYNFGIRSFLRAVVQYSDISRNKSLYVYNVDNRSKNLTTQFLYSYKINPQTRFFIGYSDTGYQNDAMDEIDKTNYTVFTKLSYAWQY